MKLDGVFLIGSINIYDYQAATGYKRWNTFQARLTAFRWIG